MSALDARMRIIAREVSAELADGLPGPDRVTELEKQVSELTARVDELEKAPRRAATAKRTGA